MDFTDQTVIVTGSSAGIGAAAALDFARRGGRVVVNYASNKKAGEAVTAACNAEKGAAICVKADASKAKDCEKLIAAAIDQWGQLDCLVNNAGRTKINAHDNLEGLSVSDFEQIYALNAIGPYQLVTAALPHLKESDNAAIVNVSSIAGLSGYGSSLAYAASKGALNALTMGLARALGPHGVRVNAVCPGIVATDWFKNALGEEMAERINAAQAARTPLGKVATPEDVSHAILFLASGMAGHISGQLLAIEGGMLLGQPFTI